MSHTSSSSNTLIIILGVAAILSLVLVSSDSTHVFAQDEDEEEKEEESEEQSSEEEESNGSKDEDEEEKEESNDESKEEEPEESSTSTNNNDSAITTPTVIPETPITNPLTPVPQPQPTGTIEAEPITAIQQPQQQQKKEFNATCKCMTTSLGEESTKSPTTPPPPSSQPNTQIPITSANIVDSQSLGQVLDGNYTGFYTVSNLLDNKIDDVSFWSQAGKSSFYIKLDNILDQYQVCSAEFNVHKPTNSPFTLDIGVSQKYNGVIDQTTEKIQFDKCVKNMDEILMVFENPVDSYISVGEIKLFGSKLLPGSTEASPTPAVTTPPALGHSIVQPQPTATTTTENATKINIQDSTAEIDIKNSTVTFKFDPLTGVFKGTQ